jgi:prepilin-type N-terminal cleavage/methylation domain-containing protein
MRTLPKFSERRPARGAAVARVARRPSAFSLVEVLCAILILGVALAGLTQGLTTALSSHKDSELQTTAALLAASQIEMLRAEGGLTDGAETEGECGAGFSLYHWRQSINPAGLDGLHEVTVTIEHAKTKKPIYELQTLLFEAPDSLTTEEPANKKSPGARRRRGPG